MAQTVPIQSTFRTSSRGKTKSREIAQCLFVWPLLWLNEWPGPRQKPARESESNIHYALRQTLLLSYSKFSEWGIGVNTLESAVQNVTYMFSMFQIYQQWEISGEIPHKISRKAFQGISRDIPMDVPRRTSRGIPGEIYLGISGVIYRRFSV